MVVSGLHRRPGKQRVKVTNERLSGQFSLGANARCQYIAIDKTNKIRPLHGD